MDTDGQGAKVSLKGVAPTPSPVTRSEVIEVRGVTRAEFIAHGENETYTGVPVPAPLPRELLDKGPDTSCFVLVIEGDDVEVYSAETGGIPVDTLGPGDSYSVTGRVWVTSDGVAKLKIVRTG